MIYGHLDTPEHYRFLLSNPGWRMAFEWLQKLSPNPPIGIQQLSGDDIYANVMTYETLPRSQCRFESHRRYVDLQFTIQGAELIDCLRSTDLEPDGPYDSEKDLQFYRHQDSLTVLHMKPRCFGIFFPEDAHRPKIKDPSSGLVFKLVVKVSSHLVIT